MQLRHIGSALKAQDGGAKVLSISWSPNNVKLAVVTTDRMVFLFDENGERHDKFSTKPADASGPKTYAVTGLAWSHDSTRLAVAQSDCIVFVYRLSSAPEKAAEWGEKKAIVNKFAQQSPVMCVVWPTTQHNAMVCGLFDGKIRLLNASTNKAQTMYQGEAPCVAIAASPDGQRFVSGHLDGKIYVSDFDHPAKRLFAKHAVPPTVLCWGMSVFVAGCDKRTFVYSSEGKVSQQFDYTKEEGESDVSAIIAAPSSLSVAAGSFNRIRLYNFNNKKNAWEETEPKQVEDLYTVSALGWRSDGSKLVVGTSSGGAEIFDCCLRRTRYKDKFEFTYIGPSQVIVKNLANGTRIVLRSNHNYEILKVNVLGGDRYIVARTTDTLMIGDLQSCALSEIAWRGSGNEKFYFENPAVCMVFNAGELSLVEYGQHEVLGAVRTDHTSPHLISVRLNERRKRSESEENKRIAYLVDAKTVAILDLAANLTLASVDHDAKIDWLELNETGRKLLFRDGRHRLYVFDIASQTKTAMLTYCTYVQWVPGSDVVVAQNRSNLCVWYNMEAPEGVVTFPIKGDVQDIVRANGATEVVVDEGVNTVTYTLDEGMIEFGTAIDDGNLQRAMLFLERLELTPESKAMWETLSTLALTHNDLLIAERAYAALGNMSRAAFMKETNQIYLKAEQDLPGSGLEHPDVRARLAMLNKQFKMAEAIYFESGDVDKVVQMYQKLNKWDECLAVAEAKGHEAYREIKANYERVLADTKQEEKIGELKESEGDVHGAFAMYMKAGLPARAARLVAQNRELSTNPDMIERVTSSLLKAGLFTHAGELFELVRMNQRALDAYRQGKNYRKAVDLCRLAFPSEVVPLEEEWGDFLVSQKQLDAAINHYIEAGCSLKAIDAAIASRQWAKAAQVAEVQDPQVAKQYFKVIAKHYAEVREFKLAEKYFVAGGAPREAVDMYIKASMWKEAHDLAVRHIPKSELTDIYIRQAEMMEAKHRYTEAEKLYLTVNEPDMAISMWKKQRQYGAMIQLVKKHHPDLVNQTYIHLARELEGEKLYTQAEAFFVSGEEWKSAVEMYRGLGMWEDAHRVAKQHGGPTAANHVGYLWARSLGGDSAIKLLTKFGTLESAVDFSCEAGEFEFAFELARSAVKHKLPHVHLKHAMYLEDEHRYQEAEAEFLQANKPREAVLMYVHMQDWDSAQRIAEAYDPESVADVLVGQGRIAFQAHDYTKAESCLLRAHRPELAIKCYKDAGMWTDALRLAKEYLPNQLDQLQDEYDAVQEAGQQASDPLFGARTFEMNGEYIKAIDAYLKVSPDDVPDLDVVEEAWEKAADLAAKFIPERAEAVVSIVCHRLIEIERYDAAADLYAGVDMMKEAIQACIDGKNFAKAKTYAKMAPEFAGLIKEKEVSHLKQGGNTKGLMEVSASDGLEVLAQQGQWAECLKQAEKQGAAVLTKYVALCAAARIQEGKPSEALEVFTQYGSPPNAQNLNIYRRLVVDMFGQTSPLNYQVVSSLREMLLNVCNGLKRVAAEKDVLNEFDKYTLIAHYVALRHAALESGQMGDIPAKLALAVLRYTDIVAPDRAFYEAGQAAQKSGWNNMAFTFFNRFLDLSEAIEENSLDTLDNSVFEGTDIPLEIPLPEKPFMTEAQRKEIKEWILAKSMEDNTEQVLDRDERGTYVASLVCSHTDRTYEPCLISGYPILSAVSFKGTSRAANKEDWNKFVMALKAPNAEKLHDVVKFMNRWCGIPLNPSFAFT